MATSVSLPSKASVHRPCLPEPWCSFSRHTAFSPHAPRTVCRLALGPARGRARARMMVSQFGNCQPSPISHCRVGYWQGVDGWFAFLDGIFVGVYPTGRELNVQVGAERFALTSRTRSNCIVRQMRECSRFRMLAKPTSLPTWFGTCGTFHAITGLMRLGSCSLRGRLNVSYSSSGLAICGA